MEKKGHCCYPLVDPPFLMGKSTISMAIFNSKLFVYQRVFHKAHLGMVYEIGFTIV